MHDYIELNVNANPCKEDITDLLAAFLAEVGYEAFEADTHGLKAYIPVKNFNEKEIIDIINDFPIDSLITYEIKKIEGKDWNEIWEKNYFQPILIDNCCSVFSSFHTDIPDAPFKIVIDPRMAFGTGHHSTTSNMIKLILKEDLNGKKVIDMGTGTGILAILCKMKGAETVIAIEIDEVALDNARDNASLNDSEILFIEGGADKLDSLKDFDLFMANINRNVILEDLKEYTDCLKDNGKLFLSGFYKDDIGLIKDKALVLGFHIIEIIEENNWVALKLTRK